MASTTYHAQLIKYDSSGNQSILNLKNTGDDVSISRTSNGNLPSTVTSAQTLANAFGSLAFKSAVTWNDVSGLASTELTVSSEGKLADARAIKALNDKIAANASNISKLNSNLSTTNSTVSGLSGSVSRLNNKVKEVTLQASSWSGDSSPYTYTISDSNIIASNTIVQISLPSNMGSGQRDAYHKARIESGDVTAGKVVLYAFGTKPTDNIPITLSIGGGY